MVDVAEPETTDDTGVHQRRRSDLIARAAQLLERAERLGSDRPPPPSPPSDPPTFVPVEDEDERASLH